MRRQLGEQDTRGLVVRAAPGELNVITVRRSARGIVIGDEGVPLTRSCRPASAGGRFCGGEFDGVDVLLGDRDDRLVHSTAGGWVQGGSGDDDIRVSNAIYCTGEAGTTASSRVPRRAACSARPATTHWWAARSATRWATGTATTSCSPAKGTTS